MQLCKATGGRCFVVEYRLAPQSPFPAALIDLFVAYMALLYPPAGSFHRPVEAKNIVLTGESSGGNLILALYNLLQYIKLSCNGRIKWNGDEEVEVPFPAGVATICAQCDLTCSL